LPVARTVSVTHCSCPRGHPVISLQTLWAGPDLPVLQVHGRFPGERTGIDRQPPQPRHQHPGPEIRRIQPRGHRPDPGGRPGHQARSRPGPSGGGRGQRHGEDHRRTFRLGPPDQPLTPSQGIGHAALGGRTHHHVPAFHGPGRRRLPRHQFHGQPVRHHHGQQPQRRPDSRGQG